MSCSSTACNSLDICKQQNDGILYSKINVIQPVSNTRNSSISINVEGSTEKLNKNHLLLPDATCPPSRLSTSSAWESLRHSAVYMTNIFFVRPCSKHKCCMGCVSLRDSILLICFCEIFALVLCTFMAFDLWLNDGRKFYTVHFQGYGNDILIGYTLFFIVSLCVITFTLTMWYQKSPGWYIIHIIWQWSLIEIFGFSVYAIINWVRYSELLLLKPSAVVLGVAYGFGAVLEFWWMVVFIDAMLFEKTVDFDRMSYEQEEMF